MYAIVEIAGKQFRAEQNKRLKVPLLEAESGSQVNFDRVLFMTDDSGKTVVGKPVIEKMSVSATVLEHGHEKTILVFKKKRRKGYQKKNGHRQKFSVIKIDAIGEVMAAKKSHAKAAETAAEEKEA
jgi:large subunit ribosomal protein L21